MWRRTAKIGLHGGRFFLWLILSLVAIIILVAVLLVSLDAKYYKELLVTRVESATGRKLVIDGETGFNLSLVPTIYVEKVRFANAAWGTRPWMLSARRVEMRIDPVALLNKELQLTEVNIVEPVIWIEKDEGGRVNWDLRKNLQAFDKTKPKTSLDWLFVQGLDARDGSLEYPQWGSEQAVKFGNLKVRIDEESRRAKVRIKGSLGEQPLEAWGALDSFETLVNRQPSAMELRVHYGNSRVMSRGTVQDLLSWEGASVDFDLELHRLSDLSSILPVKLPAFGPLKGTARLEQPEKWRSLRIQDISIVSRQPGLTAQLSGRWGGPDAPEKTDLRLLADGGLASVLSSMDVDTSAPLQISADARLLGGSDGYRLALPALRLQGEGVMLRSSGGAEGVFSGIHARIPVEAEIVSLQKIGALFGVDLPDWGPISGTATIANSEGRIALEGIKVEMNSEALQARAEGRIDDLLARSGGTLALTASSPDLEKFEAFEWVKISLPPLKKLQLEGSITLDQGEVSAEVARMTGEEEGVEVVVDGTIDDLLHFDGVKLHADGHAKSLTKLKPLFDIELPAFGPLDIKGDLLREGRGPIDFGNVEAKLGDKEIDMNLSGAFSGLGSEMQARFDVALTAGSMASFNSLAGFELPAEGPVKATAKVLAEGPKNWRMEELDARLEHLDMQLAASGRVDSLFRSWLPDLSVSVDGLSTVRVAALLNTKIPLRGSINAKARVERTEGGPLSLRDIRGSLKGEGLSVTVSGGLGQLKPLEGLDLAVDLNADNTSRIGWLKDAGLRPVGPVGADFSVTSEGNGQKYRFDLRKARIRNSDARGTLVWQFSSRKTGAKKDAARPRLDIQVVSEVLDLKVLLPKPAKRSGGFFDPAPLKTAWMRKLDGDWEFSIGRFRDQLVEATEVEAEMRVRNGKFEIPKLSAKLGQGSVKLSLALDTNRKPSAIQLQLFAKKADLARLTKARESDLFNSGEMDLDIQISGAGDSIAELMAGADGKFLGVFRNANIQMAKLDLFGADIFTSLISVINPLAKRSDTAKVECAVLNFPIKKGKIDAKHSIAMKTDKLTLLGGGEIDLRDESLNLVISPKAREGFGISAGSLAKMVGIAGTITEPRVDTHLRGYLETGAVIGAAIATSGLTLLAQGLWDRTTANSNVCQLVLGGKPDPGVSERKIIRDDMEGSN